MLKRLLCASALVPMLAAPVFAADAPQPTPAGDPVVARVDGTEIHRSEIDALIAQLPQNVREMKPEVVIPALIEQVVSQRLVTAAGYKAGLQNSDEVKDELKKAEARAVQHVYIRKLLDTKITPSMLENAYKQHLAVNPPSEEVRASHILVETEDQAKAIIDELKKGGDFAKIAKEKSKDPSAATQGGDLGYFTREAMVPEFSDAAFTMKPGEVSEKPVKSQFGWHVIKVVDRRTPPPPSFEESKGDLEEQMSQDVIKKELEGLRANAKVEILTPPAPVAPAPAAAPQPQK